MGTRVEMGVIVGLPVAHVFATLSLLGFQDGWSTDFMIVCSPAVALGLLASAQRRTSVGRLPLLLEASYCVASVVTMVFALPASENDEGRQFALLLVPVAGFAALAVSGSTALHRRRTSSSAGDHGT